VSGEDGGARSPVDLAEEAYARAPDHAGPEHTDVHDRGSRTMELLQDAVVLLNVTLLGMGFVLVGISLILVSLGAILWVDTRGSRRAGPWNPSSVPQRLGALHTLRSATVVDQG
jgi:hypothetical protein